MYKNLIFRTLFWSQNIFYINQKYIILILLWSIRRKINAINTSSQEAKCMFEDGEMGKNELILRI